MTVFTLPYELNLYSWLLVTVLELLVRCSPSKMVNSNVWGLQGTLQRAMYLVGDQ